jgi:flagellar basal body-associated protein FliL
MKKVGQIINMVYKVLVSLALLVTAILTMVMSYIMFAPDELPKPFRLVYQNPATSSGSLPVVAFPSGGSAPAATQAPAAVEPGQGLMVNMSSKIVNLADPSGRKYIKVTIALEFTPEAVETKGKKSGEEGSATATPGPQLARIFAMMPMLDDLVITTLSTKTYEELYTADGKEALRKELLQKIDQRLPDLHILSVYFTEFVVQ